MFIVFTLLYKPLRQVLKLGWSVHSDYRFRLLAESAMWFITWSKNDICARDEHGRQEVSGKTSLAKVTIKNLGIAVFGFIRVAQRVILREGSCIARRLNQNGLEHHFGDLRDHCGSSRTPTPDQALAIARGMGLCRAVSRTMKATRNCTKLDMDKDEANEVYAELVAGAKGNLNRKAATVDSPGAEDWAVIIVLSIAEATAIVHAQEQAVFNGEATDPFSMEKLRCRRHFGRQLGDLADHSKTPTVDEIKAVWRLIKADMQKMDNDGPYGCGRALAFGGIDSGATVVIAGLLKQWKNIEFHKQQRALYTSDVQWWTKGQRQSSTKRLKKGCTAALTYVNKDRAPGWIRKLFRRVNVRHTPDLTPHVKVALFFCLWRRLYFEIFLYDLHRDAILPEGQRGFGDSDWRRGKITEQLCAVAHTKETEGIQEYMAGWLVRKCDIGKRVQSEETRYFVDAMDIGTDRTRTAHSAVLRFMLYLEGQLRYKYLNGTALWVRQRQTVRVALEELAASKELRARWLLMLVALRPTGSTESAHNKRAVAYAGSHEGTALLRRLVEKYFNSKVARWEKDLQKDLTTTTQTANR